MVKSHSRFWIDCGDITVYAFDAVRNDTKTASGEQNSTPSIFNSQEKIIGMQVYVYHLKIGNICLNGQSPDNSCIS